MKTLLDRDNLVFNPPELGCVLSLSGLPGGGNKIYDRSPYGNIGAITGATWKRLPSGLWCLSFDGSDDYVDCGSNPSLDISDTGLTMMTWVKSDKEDNADWVITKIEDASHLSYAFRRYSGGDGFCVLLGDSGGTMHEYTTSGGWPTGTDWHLVVVTLDKAGLLTRYVDKRLVSTQATGITSLYISSGSSVGIGKEVVDYTSSGGAGGPWEGLIALPGIYNHALSAFEIQSHFNREKHLFGVW